MEANELRIGNILLCAERDIPYRVIAEDILVIDDGSSKSRPIPLTEEILLKCGFTFIPQGDEACQQIFTYNGFDIWMHDDGFCHDYLHGGDINYLHQLQNLYFALTNTELTVNL